MNGSQGGESYLKKYLSIPEGMAEGISTELSERRRHLHECFSQVQCYLMPHPGKKVANDDGNFDGRPSGNIKFQLVYCILQVD